MGAVVGIAVIAGEFASVPISWEGMKDRNLAGLAVDRPLQADCAAVLAQASEESGVWLDADTLPAVVAFEETAVAVQHAVEGADLGETAVAPAIAHGEDPALLLDLRTGRHLIGGRGVEAHLPFSSLAAIVPAARLPATR